MKTNELRLSYFILTKIDHTKYKEIDVHVDDNRVIIRVADYNNKVKNHSISNIECDNSISIELLAEKIIESLDI